MTFHRPTTTVDRQNVAIATAYRTVGVTPPNRTTEAMTAIAAEPGADVVAAELARESYDTTNAEVFLEQALARVARAQAADALRHALALVGPQVARNKAAGVVVQTVKDLGPAFARITKDLATAAAKLDPKQPLSEANAIRDDSTKALKQARAALSLLGPLAAIHPNRPVLDVPAVFCQLLPILELPDCRVEAVVPSLYETKRSVNEHELTGTRTIRELTRHCESDIDAALVAIAAGRYDGVTFSLADKDELATRQKAARRAFIRRSATLEEVRV